MTTLIQNEVTNKVTHGILTLETSKGALRICYSTGIDYDSDYQPLTTNDQILLGSLPDEEQNEIDDLITNEIY